jgi:hypothetical protein
VVAVLRPLEISPVGGSGEYAWSFGPEGNRSGAILDEENGFYLAGGVGGVVDDIVVVDLVCERSASVSVQVVSVIQLLPLDAQVSAGHAFCFQLTGGSGDAGAPDSPFEWYFEQRGSGPAASLDGEGCYTAGEVVGQDIVIVEDTATGAAAEGRIWVTNDEIVLTPSVGRVMIPSGSSYRLAIEGGSGVFDFEISGDASLAVELDADEPWVGLRLHASGGAASGRLLVTDRFADERQISVEVDVLARLEHEAVPYGNYSDGNEVVALGDVNGDGHSDVAIGQHGSSLNSYLSGSVFIYLGHQPQGDGVGLGPAPVQVLTGSNRWDFMGSDVAGGDFDSDGCSDVAVSAWNRNGRGIVEIWSGCNEVLSLDPYANDYHNRLRDNLEVLSERPVLRKVQELYTGVRNSRFGYSMEAGDFNGDGAADLAVASPWESVDGFYEAGRVRVYLGGEGGLAEEPWLTIDSQLIDEDGDVAPEATAWFGYQMASGDINGDGCDDLFVGAPRYNGNRGYTAVIMSVADGDLPSGCALSADPAVVIVEAEEDERRVGRLGWDVALADLDGDCVLDLVSSQWSSSGDHPAASSAGTVHVISGDPEWSPETPRQLRRDAARVTFQGDRWDNFGFGLDAGDIDHDGTTDLVVGVRYGEDYDVFPETGEVRVYLGLASPGCEGVPEGEAIFAAPISLYNASRYGDLFGQEVAVVPDVDGDGGDDLVVFAARGPSGEIEDQQDHQGRAYVFSGGPEERTFEQGVALALPSTPTLDQYGWTVRNSGDFNDDGYDDFLIGAPYYDRPETIDHPTFGVYDIVHGSAGVAFMHFGGPDGVRATPDLVFQGYINHSADDLFGYSLGSAGDFNGDGYDDIVISAVNEDNYNGRICSACRNGEGTNSNIGMVLVYLGGPERGGRHEGEPADAPVIAQADVVICGTNRAGWQLGREVHGGFDHNGDGYDDLALSNFAYAGSRGRVDLVYGSEVGEGTTLVCNDDSVEISRGARPNERRGERMASMDLNGDGCDDLLVGAQSFSVPVNASGAVIVHMGWGGDGCLAEPHIVEWAPVRGGENMGYDMVEADVNGDGLSELLVSSVGLGGGANTSAALIFEGQRLRDLFSELRPGTSQLEMNFIPLLSIMVNPTGRAGSNWGSSMVNLGDIDGDGTDDILVGARLSRLSSYDGEAQTGGAFVYLGSDDPSALVDPDIFIGGETEFPLGYFGERVAGGVMGEDGPAVLLIGAPYSERVGPSGGELGAVYLGTF